MGIYTKEYLIIGTWIIYNNLIFCPIITTYVRFVSGELLGVTPNEPSVLGCDLFYVVNTSLINKKKEFCELINRRML